jgi:hypothetical protein
VIEYPIFPNKGIEPLVKTHALEAAIIRVAIIFALV